MKNLKQYLEEYKTMSRYAYHTGTRKRVDAKSTLGKKLLKDISAGGDKVSWSLDPKNPNLAAYRSSMIPFKKGKFYDQSKGKWVKSSGTHKQQKRSKRFH